VNVVTIFVAVQVLGEDTPMSDVFVQGCAPLTHTVTGVLLEHEGAKFCPTMETLAWSPGLNADGLTEVTTGSACTVKVSVLLLPFADVT
jgi:hypothetical protein